MHVPNRNKAVKSICQANHTAGATTRAAVFAILAIPLASVVLFVLSVLMEGIIAFPPIHPILKIAKMQLPLVRLCGHPF